MQLTLTFRCRDASLPLAHKYPVQSLIYHILSQDPGFSAQLHDGGFSAGNRRFKLFTFGDLTGNYRIENGTICFRDFISLEVRSPEPAFLETLEKCARTGQTYTLNGNALTLIALRRDARTVTQNQIRVQTLSPVTAHTTLADGTTRYFSPEEPEFLQALVGNAYRKLMSFGQPIPAGSLFILPQGSFKKVVTTYKGTYITAWKGEFLLKGNPELLTFLQDTGLGAKNSQGFGMFRVL